MKTLVIGASTNTERYAYKAIQKLLAQNHIVEAVGLKSGNVLGVEIQTGLPKIENVDTITLYVGPQNQPQYYDYLLSLKPRRVIFNPGTENLELINLLSKNNIHCEVACTLVLLRTNQY